MKARVLTGSKQEIVEKVAGIDGDVREAIVFVEEAPTPMEIANGASADDIFAEMSPFTVRQNGVDDSRDALYQRASGE